MLFMLRKIKKKYYIKISVTPVVFWIKIIFQKYICCIDFSINFEIHFRLRIMT